MIYEDMALEEQQAAIREAVREIALPNLAFRPPKRVPVSVGAANNLVIAQPGGATRRWSAEETPYMVEPTDMLASREHEAVVFVGPARTGKTAALIQGWMTHNVINDPGDMLIVQMSQEKARDFSKTDIERALKHSPNLNALRSTSGKEDNLHDKMFKHGMWLKIAWPTVTNLSGSTYRYVAFTDLDRMPDDINKEGSPFTLGKKRTTTFMSRGMALAESSPGRDLTDPNWQAATKHEAPPASGILGLYNTSDRRRWYWKCPDCRGWFEAAPGVGLFNLPDENELGLIVRESDLGQLAAHYAKIVCPHCGSVHEQKRKGMFNAGGRWLQDGLSLDEDDVLQGEGMRSTIAGYWMGGVAAAFQSWPSLLNAYLQGLRQYELTGDEESLKTTVNTDQGMPYMSRHLRDAAKLASNPAERSDDKMERHVCPDETRFIVASVDNQGGTNARFVVQVHAIGPNLEQWVIDRYELKESTRPGMGTEFAPIDPATYVEDWNVITEKVMRATYRTSNPDVELRVKLTCVDTNGEDGVTDKAYEWYRLLRRQGLHSRVMLLRGASAKNAPMVRETMLGGRKPGESGDIPVYQINPNLLKDAVSNGLKRINGGPGSYHFPGWLPAAFYDELKAEVRLPDGSWSQIRKRNESLDLCVYIRAGCLRMGADRLSWIAPPAWALPLSTGKNPEMVLREDRRAQQANTALVENMRAVIEAVTPPLPAQPVAPTAEKPVKRTRRTAPSPYMS